MEIGDALFDDGFQEQICLRGPCFRLPRTKRALS